MEALRARQAVEPYLLGAARIERATRESEEWPDRDSFENPGEVSLERIYAAVVSMEGREEVSERYLAAGFTELPRDSHRDNEVARFRLDRLDPSNPFLWEREVEVGVGGRELIGSQRDLLRRKVRSLRDELAGMGLKSKRRSQALAMLKELEKGLLTRISVELKRRVFRPAPAFSEETSMGETLPLSRLSQIVYRVVPKDPSERDEEAEPMYLTLLGVDARRISFLYSGGIAGHRRIRDLDNGGAHHAWFRNRRSEETDDTAPWVSRLVLRGLIEEGASELVVRRQREEEPIPLTATGEEKMALLVQGGEKELPAIVAESAKGDRFWILNDLGNPLVLRLEEAGADLLRSVDEIRRLEEI